MRFHAAAAKAQSVKLKIILTWYCYIFRQEELKRQAEEEEKRRLQEIEDEKRRIEELERNAAVSFVIS